MSTDEQPLVLSSTACTGCGERHRHAPDCQYNWLNQTKTYPSHGEVYDPKIDYPERYTDRWVI